MPSPLATRPCGPAAIDVPAFSLGSWHTWDRAVFEETVGLLRRAIDAGVRMLDVGVYRSDADSPHDSPSDVILARALQVAGIAREDYLLSIKGFLQRGPRRTLTRQVEDTLRRHGTETADFLVVGDVDDEDQHDPEALVAEVARLTGAGKARHWAVNNWSVAQVRHIQALAAAAGIEGPQYAQLRYSVVRRSIAEGAPYRALTAETGLSIQASSIFDGGVFFGGRRERQTAGDTGGAMARMLAAADRFAEAAAALDATPAQLAAAFPLTNPACANVLVGARTPEQFDELLGAAALLERHTAEEIRAASEGFWFDRDTVDPNASWGETPGARKHA